MDVVAAAREWISHDPDVSDRRALRELIGRADEPEAFAELKQAMGSRLVFGTAGLRGKMGPGPNRLNTATVTTATAGLCSVLLAAVERPRIVIGYDARHRSSDFAQTAAGVAAAAGCEVLLLPTALPTPLLAFAVQHHDADAGIMITASHNPAADNGYKVYLGGRMVPAAERGAQLVAPLDSQVMAAIIAAGFADEIPVSDGWATLGAEIIDEYLVAAGELVARLTLERSLNRGPEPPSPNSVSQMGSKPDEPGNCDELSDSSNNRTQVAAGLVDSADRAHQLAGVQQGKVTISTRLCPHQTPENPLSGLRIVLTAMHGVGYRVAERAFQAAGATVLPVVEQQNPDPDFPTVAFPNPEEPGALDLALAQARAQDADLIVALDPDADRCAIAAPDRAGQWRQLSGDELGSLLAWYLAARIPEGLAKKPVFARSIVSGSMIDAIGAANGIAVRQTLTGFKWITRATGMTFGYEEAIGYCLNPEVVRDKDGITAGLVASLLAASLKRERKVMQDVLDELDLAHGIHLTAPLTFRVDDLTLIPAALKRLANNPPQTLGSYPIAELIDLETGYLGLESTPGYRIANELGDRVIVRPSGTEPKLKCYLEVLQPVGSPDQLGSARLAANSRMAKLKEDLKRLLGV